MTLPVEPILLDLPEQLQTERLMLRAPRFGDGALINPAIVETIEDLKKWMPWADPMPSVDDTEKWCRSAAAKYLAREQFHFLIFLKDSRDYIGTCGMHRIDWKAPAMEIGYWLRKSRWGSGYMIEAANAVADFAMNALKANRVEIRCDQQNDRSARVAERAGFALEGVLRCEKRDHFNSLRDTRVYAKIAART